MSNLYSEENIKKKRTFPVKNTVILVVLVIVQVVAIVSACLYKPKPLDIIKEYDVVVVPTENGSLDIEYSFLWEAVDTSEELTWVKIGLANAHYTVYEDSLSSNIADYSYINEDGYVALRLDFKESYIGGDRFRFSFRINQSTILCKNDNYYFYEFIPGWFNETPIEKYEFRWKLEDSILQNNSDSQRSGFAVWSGEMECGEYRLMNVYYSPDKFVDCPTVHYIQFDDSGVYNGLQDDKTAAIMVAVFAIVIIVIFEVNIIDGYVSYGRGRGFLTGYGYHVHTFGRVNPMYIRRRDAAAMTSSTARGSGRGGFGGGGCACACACACAGGGRAGCSQKDTYTNLKDKKLSNN